MMTHSGSSALCHLEVDYDTDIRVPRHVEYHGHGYLSAFLLMGGFCYKWGISHMIIILYWGNGT